MPKGEGIRQLVDAIDWSAFLDAPFAEEYRPGDVPAAFDLLLADRTQEDADASYGAMLWAVGNNHAGVLFPAAAAATPLVIRVARDFDRWARFAALQILIEFVSFGAGPGRTKEVIYAEINVERACFDSMAAELDGGAPYTGKAARELLQVLDAMTGI